MEENQALNKKNIILILLIIVIALLSIALVTAFITRSTTAKNVITFGSIKMQLIETTLDENNQEIEVKDNDILDITYQPGRAPEGLCAAGETRHRGKGHPELLDAAAPRRAARPARRQVESHALQRLNTEVHLHDGHEVECRTEHQPGHWHRSEHLHRRGGCTYGCGRRGWLRQRY